MNISFDGQFALAWSSDPNLDQLEVGDHDPQQRGFNARNLELALDGAVDPYFEGFANITFLLDNDNETEVEVEEAFMQTTDLPWGLQVKGGQFFAAFGRINPTHPHTWDFADDPIVPGAFLARMACAESASQISWTVPVSWYSQFILGMQNGQGNTGFSFRNPGDDGIFYDRVTIDRNNRRAAGFCLRSALGKFFRSQPDADGSLRRLRAPSALTKRAGTPRPRFMRRIFSTNGNRRAQKADFPS